ncbi:MAG: exodeoxyribonuclease VII small subunit [Verrucomicrobiota bacterium]
MPKSSTKDTELAFEDALSQLEELVEGMESDQMPLEDLIKNFEKGTQLYQVCEKRLDEARGRIEIIRKNRNQDNVLEPFENEAEASTEDETARATDPPEDGQLF